MSKEAAMNFIEVLKSLGGVKPCMCKTEKFGGITQPVVCGACHGTGQILDLASLLAKPDGLVFVVESLLGKCWEGAIAKFMEIAEANAPSSTHGRGNDSLYVVGPQRASNLVYEVARQLGGTAVVATYIHPMSAGGWEIDKAGELRTFSYSFSLPIPPDATVLFVTDRADEQEIREISRASGVSVTKVLPHLLALIGRTGDILTAECTCGAGMGSVSLRIISLHSENA